MQPARAMMDKIGEDRTLVLHVLLLRVLKCGFSSKTCSIGDCQTPSEYADPSSTTRGDTEGWLI